MRIHRSGSSLPLIAIVTAISCSVALAMTAARREERLMMAAYYQQKEAEALDAVRHEIYLADLAAGKAQSPILPFLNPIGEPGPHRATAAVNGELAIQYARMSRAFDHAAARPWRSVDLSVNLP